jgi:hypothetical protein
MVLIYRRYEMKRSILVVSIALALLFTTACTLNVGGDRLNFSGNLSYDKGTTLTEEQNIARNAADTEKLKISDTAGNISVKASTSGDISIKAIKKVKGTNDEMKKEVMENIDIVVEGSGNSLSVHPSTKDGKKDDLWKWAERLYEGTQVTVDFELEVPENIKVYTVDSNAGNISFNDVNGEIAIKSNAGNVDLNLVTLTGSSDIEINAGNINIGADISKASKLTVINTAGNVTLKLPASSEFDLMAKLTAGNVSGSFLSGTHINSGTVRQKINGGGTEVNVTTVAGNVTIDSK